MTTKQKQYFWDWFNFDDPEHFAAYKYFRKHGIFPTEFGKKLSAIADTFDSSEPQWWGMLQERYIVWLEKKVEILQNRIRMYD